MYQLLDLQRCGDAIRIKSNDPGAILDTEDVGLAAITGNGDVIYCNRSFLLKNPMERIAAGCPNVREIVPGLGNVWDRSVAAPHDKNLRIFDLWGDSSDRPIGHLLTFFKPGRSIKQSIHFHSLSHENHPDFLNCYTGLYLASSDAYTLKVNPAYEKIAFLPESDLVGRSLRELEEKGYFSKSVTLAVLDRLNQGGATSVSFFQKIITGKHVLVTGTPIYSEQKKLTYILTFVQDLMPLTTLARKCTEHAEKLRSFRPLNSYPSRTTGQERPRKEVSGVLPKSDVLPVIVRDPVSISTMQQVVCAAQYDSPILLTGETGVGKDLIAKYLHLLQKGTRDTPFVAVNCSAIPGELLESELFGYVDGAFSGARKGGKSGLFADAHGGILFLNEISEMPLSLQSKLLTALDEGCIRPLGSSKTKQVKTHVICATNRDLRKCIAQGSFRSDLYYRINVLTIHLPPLRERPQDILPLVHHFMARFSKEYGLRKYLSPAIQDILVRYEWPGNVRELRNLIERLLVFSTSEQISLCDLPPEVLSNDGCGSKTVPIPQDGVPLKETVRQYERFVIEEALRQHGKTADAAKSLGIDPTTLARKLKRTP